MGRKCYQTSGRAVVADPIPGRGNLGFVTGAPSSWTSAQHLGCAAPGYFDPTPSDPFVLARTR